MQRIAAQSPIQSPQFRLDLGSPKEEPRLGLAGLRFPDPPVGSHAHTPVGAVRTVHRRPQWAPQPLSPMRFVWVTQCMIILILSMLVFGLLYWSRAFQANTTYYYEMAKPFVSNIGVHAEHVMQHAEQSSQSLEHVMSGVDEVASVSLPQLMRTVNRTAAMVARLERVVSHPSVRLSLDG